jgi:16S rRNA U516 pseudouridylate synthase RsuA-like enzyme
MGRRIGSRYGCDACLSAKVVSWCAVQLAELKSAGKARVEHGAVNVDKSLAEVLAENKAKKEAEYKQRWELMKQGVELHVLLGYHCPQQCWIALSNPATDRHLSYLAPCKQLFRKGRLKACMSRLLFLAAHVLYAWN